MPKPKVLYIPLWYPSNRREGVSGVFNREHVMAMKPYVGVTVLHFMTDERRKGLHLDVRTFEDEGVPTYEITTGLSPIPKTSIFTWAYNLYRAIDRVIAHTGRPDVLHAQDDNSWVVGYYARKHGIPYVISQHWTKIIGGRLNSVEKILYRKSFQNAAVILPAHYNARIEYERMHFYGKIMWLPNVYNPKIFYSGDNHRELILLHASGFTGQKRVPNIIQAFDIILKTHPDAKLVLAGDGDLYEIKALIKKLGIGQNIECRGFLSKAELAAEMRRAKGFVFPSSFETFGCVLMEAMACGTPVLTTRVGGIPGVVPDENYGILVEVGDVQAIAEGMTKMLEETHGLDTEMIQRRAQNLFSSEAVGKRLLDIYVQAIRKDDA